MDYISEIFLLPMAEGLFEQLGFELNARFEKIIPDLMDQRYSVVPDFLSRSETDALRSVCCGSLKKTP